MARKILGRFDVWRSIVLSDEQFDEWRASETADEDITDWLLGPISIVTECDLVDLDWEPRSTLPVDELDDAGEDVLPDRILDAIFVAARGISDIMRTRDMGKISAEAAEDAMKHTSVEATLAVQRLIGDRMVYRSSLDVERVSGDPRDPEIEQFDRLIADRQRIERELAKDRPEIELGIQRIEDGIE